MTVVEPVLPFVVPPLRDEPDDPDLDPDLDPIRSRRLQLPSVRVLGSTERKLFLREGLLGGEQRLLCGRACRGAEAG